MSKAKKQSTGSMSVVPWASTDTTGRSRSGLVEIDTSHYMISDADTNGLIFQAIGQAKHDMGLDEKTGDFTMEEITQITANAGSRLYVSSSKGLSALYELVFMVRRGGYYQAAAETFGDPEEDDEEAAKKKDDPETAWKLWVNQVLVETGRKTTQERSRLKSEFVHVVPAICKLPTKEVTTKITRTGTDDDFGAHVEIGEVVFDIENIRADKAPIVFNREDIQKFSKLGQGESMERESTVGPDTFLDKTSLIRELGWLADGVDPNSKQADEILALTQATTAGIRKHVKNPNNSSDSDAGKSTMTLRSRRGRRQLLADIDTDHREAWAVTQLRPQFKLVDEVEG